jgi:cell division protein FtsI/penicillin-binding protein 2
VTGYDSASYGQTGVEASMDRILRGEDGRDPFAALWYGLTNGAPPDGLDVRLTLDLDLQKAAAAALADRVGAIVVIDPHTGAIRALASSPTYDPNRLDDDWPDLVSRTDAPLLNRTMQAQYQPGTSLGPFVAAWAETRGLVEAQQLSESELGRPVTIDSHEMACSATTIPSQITDLGAALQAGCPSPAAALGAQLGGAALNDMITAFALDQSPAIRLESPATGTTPSLVTDTQIRLAAVGQGDLVVTPVQMARAFAALLNDGSLPALNLVQAYRQPDGGWQAVAGSGTATQTLSPEVAAWVVEQLRSPQSDVVQVSASSLSGPGGERIAWFLAGRVTRPPARVVVVALESGTAEEAEQAGLSLFP